MSETKLTTWHQYYTHPWTDGVVEVLATNATEARTKAADYLNESFPDGEWRFEYAPEENTPEWEASMRRMMGGK